LRRGESERPPVFIPVRVKLALVLPKKKQRACGKKNEKNYNEEFLRVHIKIIDVIHKI
jgi:hypothetical protein